VRGERGLRARTLIFWSWAKYADNYTNPLLELAINKLTALNKLTAINKLTAHKLTALNKKSKSNPEEVRTLVKTVKMFCLNQLDHWVSKAQCKYRTYFYRLQNGHISFMLTRLYCCFVYNYLLVIIYLVLYAWKHHCSYNQSLRRNVVLRF
jgi:hypothetical protein